MSLEVGQVFAGYTVLRVLGAGGMGAVYLASHPRLPREDALKLLPSDLTGDSDYRARFDREAELAASLSHSHIVRIYDRGEHDGQLWISMEYVDGTDASVLLGKYQPGGMPADEAVAIITAVASALDYAHHGGLLHRDVKPANILLTETDGQPRQIFLADFGIARRIDDAAKLTATNMALGTAAYAAPEQLMGEPLDGRADQYALACTAFHLLAGSKPYDSGNLAVVIGQQVSAAPPSIGARRPELAGLDPVFATAMAKNPSDRFGSCQEFAHHLGQHLSGNRTHSVMAPALPARVDKPRRPRLLLGVLAAIALLLVAGGVFAGVTLTQRQDHPAVTAGLLAGTYRADFGPITGLDDAPEPVGTPALTGTYGLRSVCRSSGCVATATRLTGAPVAAATMVLDEIGGRWVGVALGSDQCRNTPSEFWQVFTLRPGPNGTLTGEYTAMATHACAEKRAVTFTRTGDADTNRLPDPASQPTRVVSPAEALHGLYHLTRTFATGTRPMHFDSAVTTYCLRTGDRCISYFHGPPGDLPLLFGGANWTMDVNQDAQCPGSAAVTHVQTTGRYALPQPAQNPIPLLSGHGHQTQSGSCSLDTDFNETLTRTGD